MPEHVLWSESDYESARNELVQFQRRLEAADNKVKLDQPTNYHTAHLPKGKIDVEK